MPLGKENVKALLRDQFDQGQKATVTARNINEFTGQDVVNTRIAQRWFNQFKEGRRDVNGRKGPEGRVPWTNDASNAASVAIQPLQRENCAAASVLKIPHGAGSKNAV